jgi:hypothetical protein
MKKYYHMPDSDWGEQPRINLHRWSCDTFIVINEDEKTAKGFVYCRFGYHPTPADSYLRATEWIAQGVAHEITETDFTEAENGF